MAGVRCDEIRPGTVRRSGLPEGATKSLRLGSYELYRETKWVETAPRISNEKERFFLVSRIPLEMGKVYHPVILGEDGEELCNYTKWRFSY